MSLDIGLHKGDCDYHLDQYIWECSCGLYSEEEKKEFKLRLTNQQKDTDK